MLLSTCGLTQLPPRRRACQSCCWHAPILQRRARFSSSPPKQRTAGSQVAAQAEEVVRHALPEELAACCVAQRLVSKSLDAGGTAAHAPCAQQRVLGFWLSAVASSARQQGDWAVRCNPSDAQGQICSGRGRRRAQLQSRETRWHAETHVKAGDEEIGCAQAACVEAFSAALHQLAPAAAEDVAEASLVAGGPGAGRRGGGAAAASAHLLRARHAARGRSTAECSCARASTSASRGASGSIRQARAPPTSGSTTPGMVREICATAHDAKSARHASATAASFMTTVSVRRLCGGGGRRRASERHPRPVVNLGVLHGAAVPTITVQGQAVRGGHHLRRDASRQQCSQQDGSVTIQQKPPCRLRAVDDKSCEKPSSQGAVSALAAPYSANASHLVGHEAALVA